MTRKVTLLYCAAQRPLLYDRQRQREKYPTHQAQFLSQPGRTHNPPVRSDPRSRTCAREGIHRSGGWRRKKGEVLVEGDDERKKKKKKDSDGMDDDQIPPSALRTLLLPPLHSETMIIPDYASLIAGTLCCCSCFSFFFFSPPKSFLSSFTFLLRFQNCQMFLFSSC